MEYHNLVWLETLSSGYCGCMEEIILCMPQRIGVGKTAMEWYTKYYSTFYIVQLEMQTLKTD